MLVPGSGLRSSTLALYAGRGARTANRGRTGPPFPQEEESPMSKSLTYRRRPVVSLVLALALATVPWTASAAPNRTSREGARQATVGSWAPADVLAALKGWLRNLWAENGCILDPSGRCLQGTPSGPTLDNGCIADPNGRCLQGSTRGNGCILDPSGRCLQGTPNRPTTDAGCIADPDGKCK